ncbi:MAG: histidine--tRNA ligase family protein [Rhodospirillales bacterium]|nr:histidine--tRNA ligase family protein [Rhodospirillales bacterium]
MSNRWTIGDLDPARLFEVDYNRDVETSSRFCWPIPNMLDENGEPKFQDPDIFTKQENGSDKIDSKTSRKDYRLRFHNHKDNASQGVKIDGTGSIMLMSPSDSKAIKIKEIIHSCGADQPDCSPNKITAALQRIYLETGIGDRWNASLSDINKKYDPTDDVENGYFGRFIYKNEISAAIYLKGSGSFDGPADGDQTFSNGTFIVFPGKTIEQAKEMIENYDPLNPDKSKKGAKQVAYDVFLQTRRLPDGSPITPAELIHQDKPKRRYHKPTAIAGFQDYPPEIETVEHRWIENIRKIFELHGYPIIRTRSVEELSVLVLEENTENEKSRIFEISSAFAHASAQKGPTLGLRFDHTGPLARYIAENTALGTIPLPFKSARIGPVWRSQDITRGMHREFVQADIDVVGDGSLPLEYDAEFPRIMCEVADAVGLGTIELGISNRKITQGFFSSLGLDKEKAKKVIGIIGNVNTLGFQGIQAQLHQDLGLDREIAARCIDFAKIRTSYGTFKNEIRKVCGTNQLLEEGIAELQQVMELLQDIPGNMVHADMSVVRGMEYYTGTVYEGRCTRNPAYPPIIVGGRYDNLVSHFMAQSRPGVGASLDITRAIDLLRDSGCFEVGAASPTKILIICASSQNLLEGERLAGEIRKKGIPAEIDYRCGDVEHGRQYAKERGIPEIMRINGSCDTVTIEETTSGKTRKMVFNQWNPA